jgi:hypothetical protein
MNGLFLKGFAIFALGSFRNFHVSRPAHSSGIKREKWFLENISRTTGANSPCRWPRSEDSLWPVQLGLLAVLSIATILTRFQKYACARGI